jgi:hypothetical protein
MKTGLEKRIERRAFRLVSSRDVAFAERD